MQVWIIKKYWSVPKMKLDPKLFTEAEQKIADEISNTVNRVVGGSIHDVELIKLVKTISAIQAEQTAALLSAHIVSNNSKSQ